jgi:valyl-tRNA synthetase
VRRADAGRPHPEELIGLDRFEARKRVVEMLEADGYLEKVEDRTIQTPMATVRAWSSSHG